jgi:hypothetical protein
MIKKFAAVIKLSNEDSALATSDGAIVAGSRKDMHHLFGDLIMHLVPISELSTIKQIDPRDHTPLMFKTGL